MKPLKETFRKNGLDYQLVKRDNRVAMFKLTNPETGNNSFEVLKVFERNTKYGHRESTCSNEKFGGWNGIASYTLEGAEHWFNKFHRYHNLEEEVAHDWEGFKK